MLTNNYADRLARIARDLRCKVAEQVAQKARDQGDRVDRERQRLAQPEQRGRAEIGHWMPKSLTTTVLKLHRVAAWGVERSGAPIDQQINVEPIRRAHRESGYEAGHIDRRGRIADSRRALSRISNLRARKSHAVDWC
jgi:hypothetical protein